MESETIVRTISNDVSGEEMSKVKLQIDTHTNYTEPKFPISRIFAINEIPSLVDRIKLIKQENVFGKTLPLP